MVRSGSVAGRCASCPGRRTNGALDATATGTLSFPLENQWRDFTHRLYPYKDLGFSW